MKGVIARRNVAVFGDALVVGRVHPVFFPAFEPVLELHFFRRDKTQAGEMKFKPLQPRRNFQRRLCVRILRECVAAGDDVLDDHRRRQPVDLRIGGIHDDQPFAGRKTDPPIRQFARRGLQAAGTLERRQAVALAIDEAVDGGGFSIGAIIQRLFRDTENAAVRTDPEIAMAILFHGANEIVWQPLRRGDLGEMAVFQTVQAAAVAADPQRAVAPGCRHWT